MADNKNLEKKEVAKKEKKDGLMKKISKFFREYKSELKKISWPTLPEVIKNSVVTIIVVLIVGLFIWAVDTVLTLGRDAILNISNSASDNNDDTIDADDILESLYDAGYNTVAISASDVSGADIAVSGSDVYGITFNGELVEGYEKYLATNANDAATMLINYALSLTNATESGSDVVSPTEASTSDAQ